jgi:hypothetical protein
MAEQRLQWEALDFLSGQFDGLHARIGRPSLPPEKLLRALLLQAYLVAFSAIHPSHRLV